MNIHDSLIVECKKELVEEVKNIMYEQMENKTREILGLRVNIKIDIAEGQNLSFK
jgi:DNA polymerase I-like protein with 3'-5' exonuclease and polymerase domains